MKSNKEARPLTEFIEIIGGGTPKTSNPDYWNGNIPWISIKDINHGKKYITSTEKSISEEGLKHSNTTLLKENDIIISARGTVGEIGIVSKPMAFNQSCYGIRAQENLNQNYLYYYLTHIVGELKSQVHGTVFDTITRSTFENIKIHLPSLDEQRNIADFLSLIDDKIIVNKKINKNLEEQTQLLFKELYERDSWEEVLIKEIVKKIASGPFGSNIKASTFKDKGVPIITGPQLNGFLVVDKEFKFITEDHAQSLKNSIAYSDDIVFTHTGTIGQVSIIPKKCEYKYYMISTRQSFIRVNKEKVVPEYLFLFLKSRLGQHELLSYGNYTGVPSIASPVSNIKKINLRLPSINIQQEWQQIVSPLFELIQLNTLQIKNLENLKLILLSKLLSGEIEL